MADFSFVGGDGGLQRKQQQPGGPAAAGAPPAAASATAAAAAASPRPGGIAIPSFREVQQAERQRAGPANLFRASGSGAGAGAAPQAALARSPGGSHVDPFAFIGGSRPGAAAGGRAPQPGPSVQQPQQRQQPYAAQPPQRQQQQQAGAYQPPLQGQGRPRFSSPQVQAQAQRQPQWQQPQQQSWQQQAPPPRPGFQQPLPPSGQQQQYAQQQQQQYAQQQQQQYAPPNPQQRPGGPGPPQQQAPQQPVPQQPVPQQPFPANAIIVSRRQEGNPVLRYIRNVRWQFGDIVPDYLLGRDTACLFLSLRYHLLKPEYIHHRIRELQRSFRLRVILCHVDTEDAVEPLAQVTRAALGNDCTLICGWSNQECARYLETFKSYEHKPAEVIQKDLGTDYLSRINATLTTVRGVNRTDVKTLGDRFGSVAAIFNASAEELQACPGIGPTKARRLHDTFHQPFRRTVTATATAAAAAGRVAAAGQQQQAEQQQQQQQQQQVVAMQAAQQAAEAAAAAADEEMEEEDGWGEEEEEQQLEEPGSGPGGGGGGSSGTAAAAAAAAAAVSESAAWAEDEEEEEDGFDEYL